MKVLITGAGLIGCHSARELAQRGHNVTLLDINPNQSYIDAIASKRRVSVLRGEPARPARAAARHEDGEARRGRP